MAVYFHLDAAGRVHNAIVIDPAVAAAFVGPSAIRGWLVPQSLVVVGGETPWIDWQTTDGGTTWVNKVGQWSNPPVAVGHNAAIPATS